MKIFLIPVVLIICAHVQAFDVKRLHPYGDQSQAVPALKSNIPLQNGIQSPEPKISGGVSASLGQIPFQVSINASNHQFVGGVIIHPYYVLSAAQRLQKAKRFTIYAGVVNLRGEESSRQVVESTEIIFHEKFNESLLSNNIALLKLSKPLIFNEYVSPAYLPSNDDTYAGDAAWISGWGSAYKHGELAPTLQYAPVTVVSNEWCTGDGGWGDVVTDSIVCSHTEKGVGECDGDYGGPLFKNQSLLIGILSFHDSRGCGIDPDIFTRISYYRDWITNHVK